MSAYFWINPQVNLEEKITKMKEDLTSSSDQKRKKLKSKQTYLSSQNKNKEEKILNQKTVEMAHDELDEI
jgi:hypothetical protein